MELRVHVLTRTPGASPKSLLRFLLEDLTERQPSFNGVEIPTSFS